MPTLADVLGWFSLAEDPFARDADIRYFAPTSLHSRVLRDVRRTIGAEAGLAVVCGREGSGKSALARVLAATLADSTGFDVHVIDASRLDRSRNALARALARSLGIHRRLADYRLYEAIEQEALTRLGEGRRVVVIADDSEHLSPAGLESLKDLWNLVTRHGDRFLVRIAIIANPRIQRTIGLPQLEAVRSRISLAVPDLAPLADDDVLALLRHRLAVAGAREGLIASDALTAIASASEGNAGTGVQVAAAALRRAFVERSAEVGSRHVEPVPSRARTGLVA